MLERLGIADEVNSKSVIVTTGHPGQVANSPGDAVAKGRAEIALHQLQELLAVPRIEIAGPFPGQLQEAFRFPWRSARTPTRETQGKHSSNFSVRPRPET